MLAEEANTFDAVRALEDVVALERRPPRRMARSSGVSSMIIGSVTVALPSVPGARSS